MIPDALILRTVFINQERSHLSHKGNCATYMIHMWKFANRVLRKIFSCFHDISFLMIQAYILRSFSIWLLYFVFVRAWKLKRKHHVEQHFGRYSSSSVLGHVQLYISPMKLKIDCQISIERFLPSSKQYACFTTVQNPKLKCYLSLVDSCTDYKSLKWSQDEMSGIWWN